MQVTGARFGRMAQASPACSVAADAAHGPSANRKSRSVSKENDMKPHVRLATLCLPAMVIFMNFPVHAADRAPSFDIVGLRLGMTVEETKKALLAYDAQSADRTTIS